MIVVIIVGLVVVFSGGGDSDDDAAKTPATGSVDISDIDEPGKGTTTTTTAEEPTTTLGRTADGRIEVDSGVGITWTMIGPPGTEEITDEDGGEVLGERWTSTNGETTEVVEITEPSGAFDVDAAIGELASRFEGSLSAIEDSNFQAGARTASFRGTLDGAPVVGYIVAAEVDDRGVLLMTWGGGADPGRIYGTFVRLPGSMVIA
jgi:hypothetical protein